MNVLHMRYAVEVARLGSINKAADELFIAQPNLSRTIKKLEDDLGITIFDRSRTISKGCIRTAARRSSAFPSPFLAQAILPMLS